MENSEKFALHNHLFKDKNSSTTFKAHGVNNWTIIFLGIFCFSFVIDNYQRYGIIKDPIEITFDFIRFIQEYWWYYAVLVLGCILQITLCLLNEKLLVKGSIPEGIGMGFHFFISIMLFNLCAVLPHLYELNPVMSLLAVTHLIPVTVKLWRYAYTNKTYRDNYKQNTLTSSSDKNGTPNSKSKELTQSTIKYPENVTLKNLLEFLFCTSDGIYKIEGYKKKPRDFKRVLNGVLWAVAIHYFCAIMIYQYLLPQTEEAVICYTTGQYLKLLASLLKISFPANLVWVSYFYFYCLKIFVPIFGWFWGTEDVLVVQDWWNSGNSTIFWRKWNFQVHSWLKDCFFLPLLQMGYSKWVAFLGVACVSGFMHEYIVMISFSCRSCYGLATFGLLTQIPLAGATTFLQMRFGDKWGNMLLWLSLLIGQPALGFIAFYNYKKAHGL